MQLLSDEIHSYLSNSSWIRRMFEAGIELKKKYGDSNVYDFSLGNPDLPPPETVQNAMFELAGTVSQPFSLGYMPNAGFAETRTVLAKRVSVEQSVDMPASNIVVTCGAAGGLNIFFRAVLTQGDEVLCPAPYFVEYGFYTSNFGGKLIPVPSRQSDFSLDLDGFEKAITAKTRAVIINSPNNPTGRIYTRAELTALAALLKTKSEEFGRVIYLISDEPYRFLNFDNLEIPSLFSLYEASVVIGSFSKSLSLAGERVGYVAVNPALENAKELIAGLVMTNRILGFVNAPCVGQKLLQRCIDSQVDLNIYRTRRQLMANVLKNAGIEFFMPSGAFYFFAKSPMEDESVFINALVNERVLAVPGRGFGMPGFFRLAFCVQDKTITDSAESFKRAVAAVKQ